VAGVNRNVRARSRHALGALSPRGCRYGATYRETRIKHCLVIRIAMTKYRRPFFASLVEVAGAKLYDTRCAQFVTMRSSSVARSLQPGRQKKPALAS